MLLSNYVYLKTLVNGKWSFGILLLSSQTKSVACSCIAQPHCQASSLSTFSKILFEIDANSESWEEKGQISNGEAFLGLLWVDI